MGGKKIAAQRPPSRFSAWKNRMADRLARSSRIFLLSLTVACGIEVIVDLNQTIFEINVLRERMRQKGLSSVGILAKAGAEPVRNRDVPRIERVASGLFDDDDVAYVRFTDEKGVTLYDRLEPTHEPELRERYAQPFREHFAHQMNRDINGILTDPDGFKQRLAKSRYRDFVQTWNDAVSSVTAVFVTPKPRPAHLGLMVYQDRLRDDAHRRDSTLTWALGTVVNDDGKNSGAVLVAFSMEKTNDAIVTKYLKGAGMVVFFVGLILVQNILSRRDKLRLLELETRHAAAKKALRDALPETAPEGSLEVLAALEQAGGAVDGMLWDVRGNQGELLLAVIDPDGDGIDAAAVALHVQRAFRTRRDQGLRVSLDEEAAALGEATRAIPLTRPVGLLLVRIAQTGEFEALSSPMATLRRLRDGNVEPLRSAPLDDGGARGEAKGPGANGATVPAGVVGPLSRTRATLERGESLLAVCAGLGAQAAHLLADTLAEYLARTERGDDEALALDDAALWARGKATTLAESDLVLLRVRRGDGAKGDAAPS